MANKLVLVTGATGYIASRLIPTLLERGYAVRCLVRHPQRLKTRAWFPYVEVVQGDVSDPPSLAIAMDGIHTGYYLVHSMASGHGYIPLELAGARNFASAAEQAGVKQIIYLGGLADPNGKIAAHMRSRIQTGETLRRGNVPVTEFRAGVIVGPGSISFEMIRFMTELMPVIFGPTWLKNISQPIAIQNVIDYLVAGLENPAGQNKTYEIGGPDRMSYTDLMQIYGRLRGLRRRSVFVPGIPLWFMAMGVAWMTPVPSDIARPLVDGLRSDSLVQDDGARHAFPHIQLIGYEEGVKLSLERLHPARLEPAWTDCDQPVNVMKHEGFFIDHRCIEINAVPEKVFQVVSALGGKNSWLFANWLWRVRGWLDRLLGGPGMRGRRADLRVGDVVDFYRIDAIEDGRLLRLHSELKAPGEGWMEWRVERANDGTRLSQTGFFAPCGFPGFAYWYLFAPLHKLIFRGLLSAIAQKSETS
jgi:uncharacterized protein YbjT (DUF2867 family)